MASALYTSLPLAIIRVETRVHRGKDQRLVPLPWHSPAVQFQVAVLPMTYLHWHGDVRFSKSYLE
jgi:hypothetical protein